MSFVDSENKICFIHIAKNAGKSISKFLCDNFESSNKIYDEKNVLHGEIKKALKGRNLTWGMGSGHMTHQLFLHDFKDENTFCFTIIRHPVDRLISCYNYITDSDINNIMRLVNRQDDCKNIFDFIDMIDQVRETNHWDHKQWYRNMNIIPHIVPQTFYFDIENYYNKQIKLFLFEDIDNIGNVISEKFDIKNNNLDKIPRMDCPKRQPKRYEDKYDGLYRNNRAYYDKILKIYDKDYNLYERIKAEK